ncbi:hypothetical protein [Croceiramulus getboli]|nr:hypothetical protein P8624_07095 [Flavobacteriaceae bacterium YJPT1-3]
MIPRVALNGTSDTTTITSPVESLLVYNTATTGDVAPGFYYWNGSNWSLLTTGTQNAWDLNGNALSGTEFLGSTNNEALEFRVNNIPIGLFAINDAINLGRNSSNTADDALAIGFSATTTAINAIAIGTNATAQNIRGISLGANSVSSADDAVAIGESAISNGIQAIALGFDAQAQNLSAVALGDGADAFGTESIAIGNSSDARDNGTIAIGDNADANGANSIAIGDDASTRDRDNTSDIGIDAIAIGDNAEAYGDRSIAIGDDALASINGTIAIGDGAQATNFRALAIGDEAVASANDALALGDNATASGTQSIAIGKNAVASNTESIAIGDEASATGNEAVAIGAATIAPNDNTIILGNGDNVGIGTNNPQETLQVEGSLRYVDGNQAAGSVLTSDANGTAIWQAPASTGVMMRRYSGGSVGSTATIFNFDTEEYNSITGTSFTGTSLTLPQGVYKVHSSMRLSQDGSYDYTMRLDGTDLNASTVAQGTVTTGSNNSTFSDAPMAGVVVITAATGIIDFRINFSTSTGNLTVRNDQSYLLIEKIN